MKKIIVRIIIVMYSLVFLFSVKAELPEPLIYLPFEWSWLNEGSLSGYANVVTAGGSTPKFSPGKSGWCFDITSAIDNGTSSGSIYYDTINLSGLKSFTVTWWVNAADQVGGSGTPFSFAYYFSCSPGGKIDGSVGFDGQPNLRVNGQWEIVPTEDSIAPANGWIFYAMSYDSTVDSGEVVARFYMAHPNEGDYLDVFREVSLNDTYRRNNAGSISSPGAWVVGNRDTSGNQGMDGMMDEFRLFGSFTDNSGALSIEQIEEILVTDLSSQTICTEYLEGDFDENCYVDFTDFALFCADLLKCTDESNPDCDKYWQDPCLASQRWHEWRKSWTTFPIAAWSYFISLGGTPEEYITYENANLTMVQSPLSHYDYAVDANLRPLIGTWEELKDDEDKLAYFVRFSNEQEGYYNGYLLEDEPAPNEFDALGEVAKYIYRNDKQKGIPMVNLYASYSVPYYRFNMSYRTYVDKFIAQSFPPVIIFDHYPVLNDGIDTTDYYENIEIFREKSLANNIGFMGFVLITPHTRYRDPSESDLRWQAYSLITYGAKGIWYYTFQSPLITIPENGMVSRTTKLPTHRYYLAQAINAELKALGPVLLKLKSVGVYHTLPNIPAHTTVYSNGVISSISSFSGQNFLLGEFQNMDEPNDTDVYLMITNKRHAMDVNSVDMAANATFTVNPPNLNVYKYEPTSGQTNLLSGDNGTYTESINGGQGILFRFSQDLLP